MKHLTENERKCLVADFKAGVSTGLLAIKYHVEPLQVEQIIRAAMRTEGET